MLQEGKRAKAAGQRKRPTDVYSIPPRLMGKRAKAEGQRKRPHTSSTQPMSLHERWWNCSYA